MKRIIMMVLRLGLLSIYYFILVCIKSNSKIKNYDENYHLISNITNWSKRNLQVLNLINNSLDDKSGILIFTKIMVIN